MGPGGDQKDEECVATADARPYLTLGSKYSDFKWYVRAGHEKPQLAK